MSRMKRLAIAAALVLGTALGTTGCIGLYNSTGNFLNNPPDGMDEATMLKTYGKPSFATDVEDSKVYIYEVRDNKYIILVGVYDGYDLIVECRDGRVTETSRVQRPKAFALFQPLPWAEAN